MHSSLSIRYTALLPTIWGYVDTRVPTTRTTDTGDIPGYYGAWYFRTQFGSVINIKNGSASTHNYSATLSFDTKAYSTTMVGSDTDVRPKSSTVKFMLKY